VPILAPEPMIYPADLLDTAELRACSSAARWFVAHTRPRQEKALARYLYSRRIGYFAPQYTRRDPRRSAREGSCIPLFSGYVFVHADDAGRLECLQSNRVAAALKVVDQAGLLADLRRVKRLIDSRLPLYPEERLAPGRRVRIVCGPLAGLEGVVEGRVGRLRFTVGVEFIHQGVSVEVDARALEPIGHEADLALPAHGRTGAAQAVA